MPTLTEVITAASAGAASIGVKGWEAEECMSAALERVAASTPRTTAQAYRAGKWAALDELRRLTGGRRQVRNLAATWPDGFDPAAAEEPDTDTRDRILEWAVTQPARTRRIVAHVLDGHTFAAAAEAEGITAGRVTQLLRAS